MSLASSSMTRDILVYKALIEARTLEGSYFQLIAFVVRDWTDLGREKLRRRIDAWLRAIPGSLAT